MLMYKLFKWYWIAPLSAKAKMIHYYYVKNDSFINNGLKTLHDLSEVIFREKQEASKFRMPRR